MISVFSKKHLLALGILVFWLCPGAFVQSVFCQPPAASIPENKSKLDTFAAELIKAGDETKQIALLEQNPNLVTADLFEIFTRKGFDEQTRGNFRQALAFYALAKIIAEKKGDRNQIARATRDTAIAEFQLNGNFEPAFEKFQKSLRIFESLGERQAVAKTLNNLGILHLSQGEYQKALEYFRQSLERTDGEKEKPELARTLNNIGIVERRLGNYAESLAAFHQSLKITEDLKMNRQSAHTMNNLQAVYKERGDYRQALKFLQKALSLEELRNDQDLQARLAGNTGEIYFLQNDYEQALRYFRDSLKIGETIGDKWLNHQVELKISRVYRLQENYLEALKYAERSLKTSEQIGDQPGKAASLTEIGNINLDRNDATAALDFFNRSLQINENIGDRAAAGTAQIGIALAYLKQNQFEKALAAARQSAESAAQIGNLELLWQARSAAGRALKSLKKPVEAQKYFADAIAVIEVLRLQIAGRERERELFFESKLEPYHQLIELFIEQKNFHAALEMAERAKGRVLLDVLESGRADLTKHMTSAEKSTEQRLRGAITSLNLQLVAETAKAAQADGEKISAFNARLQTARENYEAFQTNLFVSQPEIKLERGNTEPFNLNRSANSLPPGTAFLEFIVTGEKIYLAVVKKQAFGQAELKIYPLAVSARQLSVEVKNFRDLLALRYLDYENAARKLFDDLLKPAMAEISDAKTLCLIPDGFLWELPFQALVGLDGKFLIEKQAIFYASSLSVLQAPRKAAKPSNPRSLFALGNPTLIDAPETIAPENSRNALYLSLPNAEKEVSQLGEIYGTGRSLILSGRAATEAVFKKESGKFGVLHLATHAVLEDANPMYSRILLSGSAEKEANEDGMLETWEILGMNLGAELVVLSACETGRGRIGAGEGVIGLSWAFFVAGTPSAVISQWKVDSASTTDLMIRFHRNLNSSGAAQANKATALQAAANDVMKDKRYRHPFYWAGFVLVGNGQD